MRLVELAKAALAVRENALTDVDAVNGQVASTLDRVHQTRRVLMDRTTMTTMTTVTTDLIKL